MARLLALPQVPRGSLMNRGWKSARMLVLIGTVLVFATCSRNNTGPGSSQEGGSRPGSAEALNLAPDLTTQPGNTFQATFTDKVVKMEQPAFIKSIRSISSDNTTFVFDPSDGAASKLYEGSILFVPGIAMRKVDLATRQENNLVVVTEDAPLLEALKDANIKWSTPVNFGTLARASAEPESEPSFTLPEQVLAGLHSTVYADSGGLSLSGEDDGWAYTVKASPQPDKLNLDLDVSRKYNGLVVKVTGSGYVQNFETAATIMIKHSQLKYFDYQNKNLNGQINFGWEAAKDEAGVEAAEQKIKLPSSFSIPLPIGGLPFSLEVSEALLLHPAFTGGKEVARGRFNVAYNGVQGFNIDQGNVNQEGQGNAEGSILDNFSLSPIAPVGFVAAVAMPRIELKLGTDTVFQVVKKFAPPGLADAALNLLKKTPFGNKIQQAVSDKLKTTGAAYAQVVITTSTIAAGAGSLIPCQKARLITTIQVGANATILGKEKGKVSKDIFHQEKTIVIPPTKSCDV
jgi:hypothetical protein